MPRTPNSWSVDTCGEWNKPDWTFKAALKRKEEQFNYTWSDCAAHWTISSPCFFFVLFFPFLNFSVFFFFYVPFPIEPVHSLLLLTLSCLSSNLCDVTLFTYFPFYWKMVHIHRPLGEPIVTYCCTSLQITKILSCFSGINLYDVYYTYGFILLYVCVTVLNRK